MANVFGLENKEDQEYELEAPKQINVFDYVKSINTKENYLGDDLGNYSSYIINKAISGYEDCLRYVKEMNSCPLIPDKFQYDFYYYAIPKKKRYAEWYKKDLKSIENVVKFYNVSEKKALEFLKILNDEQLKHIEKSLTYGVTEK